MAVKEQILKQLTTSAMKMTPMYLKDVYGILSLGVQGNQIAAVEEPNIKIGRYSEEERKERILLYLKKRNLRNFNKTIKYACRKTLADRRVRVRGRFARNSELCEEETAMTKTESLHKEDLDCGDSIHYQINEFLAQS
ncbi:hypothetical protein L6164_002279 [Bauhinia variegata]|uniref:Uncharacterized protein n=1 Tax=Bauhinia variegata TaxID=167791 RepID=A0ACB9PX56_BAUVA|nr:hypothetical protein L6164_002279 [Bauhinia variegata]